ncbi:MAG TPA: hypothetical protein PK723_04700 [Candidatus Pacearchaeota archaeon]|nr:hypothetical protein [Candidatus Pacearchaeota archaeon]HPZ75093.1 hypothetical protein [Candidatus Pacearchaeota archaeon]HQD89343.1 hypothetical protein [Candidatus Pacearchaeota archaeon]
MSIEDFFLFFHTQLWENLESILKPTAFIAIVIFLWAIIWALKNSSWIYWYITADAQEFMKGSPVPLQKKAQQQWKRIKKRLRSRKEASWKLAIIEGGEIVDDLLFKMGYKANGIKARLALANEAQISNLDELIKAAEVYEGILADPDYKLSHQKAEETLRAFEKFLKSYQYLN